MTITTIHNQSLLDIAIQTTGKAENLLKIAMANNLVPTDPIAPGTILTIPDNVVVDEAIVKFYEANNVIPATEISVEQAQELELTFIQKVHKILKG